MRRGKEEAQRTGASVQHTTRAHAKHVQMPPDARPDDTVTDRIVERDLVARNNKNKRRKTDPAAKPNRNQSSMNVLRSFADLGDGRHPRLSSLTRYDGVCMGDDLPLLSPGAAYGGNRVACMLVGGHAGVQNGGCHLNVLVGSGRHLYELGCCLGSDGNASGLERGKGGHVYLPSSDPVTRLYTRVDTLSCRAEIQSVSTARGDYGDGSRRVLLTDMYGRGVCGTLSAGDGGVDGGVDGSEHGSRLQLQSMFPLNPDDSLLCVEGGLTVGDMSNTSSYSAIGRHFPKDVTVFDGDVVVRTFHTLGSPTDVKLVGDSLVTVAEGNMVTVYDVRIADRQTRVARLQPVGSTSSGHIYSLAVRGEQSMGSGGGAETPGNASCPLLGAGGEDRDVYVWDPRVWKSVNQWKNCVKYEITSLHFLDSDPRYCVVSGMDYEVACGAWFENKSKVFTKSMQALGGKGRATGPVTEAGSVAEAQRQGRVVASYRGMSRWIGMSKLEGQDVFVGVTTDGKVYQSSFSM